MIAAALQQVHDRDRTVIVAPKSVPPPLSRRAPEHAVKERVATAMWAYLDLDKTIGRSLIDRLVEANKEQRSVSFGSSLSDGFVIDEVKAFDRYMTGERIAWKAWYRDHPGAGWYARVSLPAYDPEREMVITYVEMLRDDFAEGWVVLFRWEGGQLRALYSFTIWSWFS